MTLTEKLNKFLRKNNIDPNKFCNKPKPVRDEILKEFTQTKEGKLPKEYRIGYNPPAADP